MGKLLCALVVALLVAHLGSSSGRDLAVSGESEYLERALESIQTHALTRDRIDWPGLRSKLLSWVDEPPTRQHTYDLLRYAIRELADGHSRFFSPTQWQHFLATAEKQPPEVRVFDDVIGYLLLPGFADTSAQRARGFASAAHAGIATLDSSSVRAWIVDLRFNRGGNMWPMIAAVGPILGDGVVGSFVFPDSQRSDWIYSDGRAISGEAVLCEIEEPYSSAAMAKCPVAVLISDRTASAGEAVAVAFRGRADARFFGTPTSGQSTGCGGIALDDGACISLATCNYADRTGAVQDRRVIPDQAVWLGDGLRSISREDPAISAARQWLAEMVSREDEH